jgi:hypothetical protein
VTCCFEIQNECSESFETPQGLRQGDVLSTLLFNVVLEVIVRRANLQTTGTIYSKETQLLTYADDLDIVGRSQSAVRGVYLALKIEAAKVGLKINEQKTKYMIPARNVRTIRDVGQIHHSQELDPLSLALRQWDVGADQENQLLVFEKKVLRTICGPKMVSAGENTTTNSMKSLTAQMP